MPLQYLKRAAKAPEAQTDRARAVVAEMLAEIEKRGEAAVKEYAQKLDAWTGDIVVQPQEIERRTRDIPAGIKRDIEFATERVRRFALAQKASLREFETEVAPGLKAGQRLVPVNVAGGYVATRRYPHIASAYMSARTADAAAGPPVGAASPPDNGEGGHPPELFAMR